MLSGSRGDLPGERVELVVAVAPEDEGVEAVGDCHLDQLVDSLIGRSVEGALRGTRGYRTRDIEDASERVVGTTGRRDRLVESPVMSATLARSPRNDGTPATGDSSREFKCPRPVHAEPDPDVVRRQGPACAPSSW